ncbi:hypothetical protein [Candidatus Nanohalococcus occultus]|uniref:DoxX family protein n=1 Tax=Candidatus Nanohalococcus occultus TaxID=2978047 RepID=A0ABY8CIW9_9ARCH|nr:hypothetical protein SVXNc_0951 [Candidatus Nanohaloarchaeota archaeon SVXNc]
MELPAKLEQLDVTTVGLSLVFLLAGLSKLAVPQFWTGYEPEFVLALSPVSAGTLLGITGLLEAALGIWILTGVRKTFASLVAVLWLTAITLQVTQLGLYAIAIRDLGLVFLALAIFQKSR